MKLIRSVILGLALAFCSVSSTVAQKQDAPTLAKGYDIGACRPDGFAPPGHLKFVGEDFVFDEISPAPGVVENIEKDDQVTYKYQREAKEGRYYLYKDEKHTVEFVVNFSQSVGYASIDGKKEAIILTMPDDDGSKLADNGMVMYNACLAIIENQSQNN